MSFPSVHLEDYFLTKLHLDCKSTGEDGIENWSLWFDYDVLHHEEKPMSRLVKMKAKIKQVDENNEPLGLVLDCEIFGIFQISDDTEEKYREGLVRMNAVSMLYSTLRGIVGNLSGSMPMGRQCLPAINPKQIAEEVEARKKKESSSKDKPSPRKKKTVSKQ